VQSFSAVISRALKFGPVRPSGRQSVRGGKVINQVQETVTSIGPKIVGSANAKTKIIKRYQNRKLYDTQQSCYVTLDDIAKMIRTNEDVMVIDNKTKNDITAATLTQIIFEAEKKASTYAPLFTLREIIQNANGSISSYLAKLGAFPKDYAKAEPAMIQMNEKASFDDVKQTLENRVAKAATANDTEFAPNGKFLDDQTPSLPNSNKSLNQ
jgi:polyhydroxyalkanoate synthesis repressor PhaR